MASLNPQLTDSSEAPHHVAIIMDGNGRFAQANNQPRIMGHRSGLETVQTIVEASAQRGVAILTLFAFGQENWRRPAAEVNLLMRLFVEAIDREVQKLHQNKVRLSFVGDLTQLPKVLQARIDQVHVLTEKNTGLQLNIAVSFSGRWQIVDAVNQLQASGVEHLTEETLGAQLSEDGCLPDVDLLIRTSGVRRLSNFLLWQCAYAEFYFCDKHWPEFTKDDFDLAIADFLTRQRRFGQVAEQL